VIRFNAEGIAGLCDRKRSGPKPFLDEGQQAVLRTMVLRGPDPDRDGVSAGASSTYVDSARSASARPIR